MRRAGFRYVFLGIESILEDDSSRFSKRAAKSTQTGKDAGSRTTWDHGDSRVASDGMFVVGGLIVGNPDDTRAAIDADLTFARKTVDWPYIKRPMPYPGTPMTKDFRDRGLIVGGGGKRPTARPR